MQNKTQSRKITRNPRKQAKLLSEQHSPSSLAICNQSCPRLEHPGSHSAAIPTEAGTPQGPVLSVFPSHSSSRATSPSSNITQSFSPASGAAHSHAAFNPLRASTLPPSPAATLQNYPSWKSGPTPWIFIPALKKWIWWKAGQQFVQVTSAIHGLQLLSELRDQGSSITAPATLPATLTAQDRNTSTAMAKPSCGSGKWGGSRKAGDQKFHTSHSASLHCSVLDEPQKQQDSEGVYSPKKLAKNHPVGGVLLITDKRKCNLNGLCCLFQNCAHRQSYPGGFLALLANITLGISSAEAQGSPSEGLAKIMPTEEPFPLENAQIKLPRCPCFLHGRILSPN